MEGKPLGRLQLVSMERLKSNIPVATSELSIEICDMQQVFSDRLSDMDQGLTGMVLWRTFLQSVHTQRKVQ